MHNPRVQVSWPVASRCVAAATVVSLIVGLAYYAGVASASDPCRRFLSGTVIACSGCTD